MRRSAKIVLALFVLAAVGLYITIYAVPKTQGMLIKTVVLEYGSLPVMDKAEMLLVRDETLYTAAQSGSLKYSIAEGTKVRRGVRILDLTPGAGPETTRSGIEDVRERAGGDAVTSENGTAEFTAVVSYHADGLEKRISPETMGDLDRTQLGSLPRDGTRLRYQRTNAGDPVFKLTDNNLWYMVYWMDGKGEKDAPYEVGKSVQVDFGTTRIEAVVQEVKKEKDGRRITLRSDVYYKDLTLHRVLDAEVIFAEHKGIVAESSSVVRKGGQDGVYVKQRSGTFKWVPVRVNHRVGTQCTLAAGKYYDKKGEEVPTVNYYDEVLLDPKSEGYK
jgi:putative membrane fusion protein